MTKEEKNRGKAAVDLIGAQLGKSGGAWITQAMLLLTGTLTNSLPFVMAAFTGIILVWIQAVWKLEADMKQTEEKREQVGGHAVTDVASRILPGGCGFWRARRSSATCWHAAHSVRLRRCGSGRRAREQGTAWAECLAVYLQDLAEEERIRDEKYKDESKLWEAGSATQGGDSGREGASTVRVGSAPA